MFVADSGDINSLNLKLRWLRPYAWAFYSQIRRNCLTCYAGHIHAWNKGYLFDFTTTHAISTPVKSIFGLFVLQSVFPRWFAPYRLVSKDVEFFFASFDLCEKFVARCPPTQTPTHKLKSRFSMFGSQETGSRSVLFLMIFQALKPEILRFNLYALSFKIPKIPEFNLDIGQE